MLKKTMGIAVMAALVLAFGFTSPAGAHSNCKTAQPGDTLSRLFPDSWRTVAVPSGNPNLIYPGQRLCAGTGGGSGGSGVSASNYVRAAEYAEALERARANPAPAPAPQPAPAPAPASLGGGTVWDRLAQCESGGNWSINTGNGYYGGLQFSPSSWRAAGGSGMPHHASRSEQIRVAENLLDMQGWGAWPACSSRLGLR